MNTDLYTHISTHIHEHKYIHIELHLIVGTHELELVPLYYFSTATNIISSSMIINSFLIWDTHDID